MRRNTTATEQSYLTLGNNGGFAQVNGYPAGQTNDGNPLGLNFQATDLPFLGDTRITGNNLAFFFTKPVRDANGAITDIEEDTSKLKELMKNILETDESPLLRPVVRLQVDANLFTNPELFVKKYQHLRSEPEQATREAILRKEVDIIRKFVLEGGIENLASKVINEQSPMANEHAKRILAGKLASHNVSLEGVQTKEALKFATWEVKDGDQVRLLARQDYVEGTIMTARPFQLVDGHRLEELRALDHEGTQNVENAVAHTRGLDFQIFRATQSPSQGSFMQ